MPVGDATGAGADETTAGLKALKLLRPMMYCCTMVCRILMTMKVLHTINFSNCVAILLMVVGI